MKGRNPRALLLLLCGLLLSAPTLAQEVPAGNPGAGAPGEHPSRSWQGQESGPRPLVGKITAIRDGVWEVTPPDGPPVTVKWTSETQFRKDRETAKPADFKVGDLVAVRGEESADHTVTAKMIGTRAGGPGGRPGGGMMMPPGTLGKDYVAGEIKAIDPPRMTVVRTDDVTEELELNEETSLRRGRESITMADLKVGDHVLARGAVEKDVFVPKGVMVMSPEQWKRFEDMRAEQNSGKPATPPTTTPKP